MNQLNLTIVPGQDGGLIVYEFVDGNDQIAAFGGDLDATTKYLSNRMSKVVVTTEQAKTRPAKSEPAVKLVKAEPTKIETAKTAYVPRKSVTELLEQLPAE